MKSILRTIYLILAGVCCALTASALPLDRYTQSSVLSSGKWVKISVTTSGMHCIPASTLSSWGFDDPARVRVHGYGGAMIPEILSAANYIDDLPRVASRVTSRGLVFYATGPQQINMDTEISISHAVNPYSSYGYYFLTEGDSPTPAPAKAGTALASSAGCVTSALWMAYYDPQEVSIGNTGRMMVGDDFKTTRTRTYTLSLPQRTPQTDATLNLNMVANAPKSISSISLTVNGTKLPSSTNDQITGSSGESTTYGIMGRITKNITTGGESLNVGVTLSNRGNIRSAWLNYIEIVYRRNLAGSQHFLAPEPQVASTGAAKNARHVWDVTDPAEQYELNVGPTGAWRNDRAGIRRYAVWSENDDMPVPAFVGNVSNQNLHGLNSYPDMVIITPTAFTKPSEAIAEIHRNYNHDPLKVEVVNLDKILNEFGSGAFDPGAIRAFLKMMYDRGQDSGAERPLRFALLMGKGTFDNRSITAVGRSLSSPMPLWVSENSLNDSQSYSTDDYFAQIKDNAGALPNRDQLCIAVGRIPATTVKEASTAADKIRRYLYSMPTGQWRNRMTVLADDGNSAAHMIQADSLVNNLTAGRSGSRMIVDKIYCDAYERQNSTYPMARSDLFRNFSDGMTIFTFIGHGSPTSIGSKNMIQPTDFRDRFYLRKVPFFYAATCSFLKWDTDVPSQAEKMMFQADGGIIGCMSALRPVYISDNGKVSGAFGRVLGDYDSEGKVPTVGELYMRTKNLVGADYNKLRYVLMGDPAMRLAFPSNEVTLDAINGEPVNDANPYTVMARQELTLTGRITDSWGNMLSDFNGTVMASFYDAEFSTTSHGYDNIDNEGKEHNFEQIGELLFVASGNAKNGEYSISVRMPQSIADNYRPATMSLYAADEAASGKARREAAGASRNLYAFGYDESTPTDKHAPQIHHLTLNDDNFTSGDDVNPAPLLIARISDDTGLNVSTAGVGQRMTLTVDGSTHFDDLAGYFTPDANPFAGRMSGTLYYPVSSLSDGEHHLRLRIWDIDGNYTDSELDCNVRADLAPEIYEVFTDALPARTEARFYVRHNRTDQIVKVTVGVYDLMGRHVWSGDAEARSDMQTSTPLVWDLRNEAGHRVPRGIYIYRAEIATGESRAASASKKLAVANE